MNQNLESGPDTSNFPRAFTDQEITDAERGLEETRIEEDINSDEKKRMLQTRASRLFKNFDFSPDVDLDTDAKDFEKMVMLQNNEKPADEEASQDVLSL